MKILHIVAGVWPGSGIAEVVAGLARAMRVQGHEVSLATTQDNTVLKFEPPSLGSYAAPGSSKVLKLGEVGVRVVGFGRSWPRAVYFSWVMVWGLGQEVREADTVHVHGCWTFPVWFGAWLALRHKKVLVMSPHGSLDPVRLQHSAWKKRLVGWMDRWLLRRASVVHATCESEKRWVQAFLKLETGNLKLAGALRVERPRIVVIPNGVGE
jgi:glycosyltransferase involved in cell wall biosynthesis